MFFFFFSYVNGNDTASTELQMVCGGGHARLLLLNAFFICKICCISFCTATLCRSSCRLAKKKQTNNNNFVFFVNKLCPNTVLFTFNNFVNYLMWWFILKQHVFYLFLYAFIIATKKFKQIKKKKIIIFKLSSWSLYFIAIYIFI